MRKAMLSRGGGAAREAQGALHLQHLLLLRLRRRWKADDGVRLVDAVPFPPALHLVEGGGRVLRGLLGWGIR
jgi:hypothetical protein